jgi:hypothetical protein
LANQAVTLFPLESHSSRFLPPRFPPR